MASQTVLDKDECVPEVDFSSDTFTTPREPVRDLINTFSDLYIDSENESEDSIVDASDFGFPPPPPPATERERPFLIHLPTSSNSSLIDSICWKNELMNV